MPSPTTKPRILTGDTPTHTGLHLGHYVGSLENRLKLQDEYDCYFLIANVHAFTTLADKPAGDATPTIASVAIAEATTAHAASTTRVRPVIGIIDPHLQSAPTSWTDPTAQLLPVWDDRRPRPVPCDARPRPGLA